MPPMAGLQDICAIRTRFSVNKAVRRPIRAAAMAASQPACPAPTTTTSYCSVNGICFPGPTPRPCFYKFFFLQGVRRFFVHCVVLLFWTCTGGEKRHLPLL